MNETAEFRWRFDGVAPVQQYRVRDIAFLDRFGNPRTGDAGWSKWLDVRDGKNHCVLKPNP